MVMMLFPEKFGRADGDSCRGWQGTLSYWNSHLGKHFPDLLRHKETKPFSLSGGSNGQRQETVCQPAVAERCYWKALHCSKEAPPKSRAGGSGQPLWQSGSQVAWLCGLFLKQL